MPDHDMQDALLDRHNRELAERNSLVQGIVGAAQDAGRDLTDSELEMLSDAKQRIVKVTSQVEALTELRSAGMQARQAAAAYQAETTVARRQADYGDVEYRSAGAFLLDQYKATFSDRDGKEARERIDRFENRAAAHQKTSDNLGLIPDPVIGGVVNFVDSARPLVSFIGPQAMPSATWHRPKVTQHTTVAVQGSAGAAADEKSELSSQKMTITRLDANAVTYGGYVNVSRQNIDFSTPLAFDVIVNDLAAQYAVQTEAALGAALIASTNETELATASAGTPTADELVAALWSGVASIFSSVKGAGRVALAVSPSKLGAWAGVFSPINPQNAQSTGFMAGDFGSGIMGNVSGIPVIMSSGIAGAGTDYGVLFSTAAVEVYEQRVGMLQAIEPSVLGVQVAYAGYFTPLTVETGGVRRIVNEA